MVWCYMGFYKYYPNRKDWRKQYTDSRSFDSSCRCHGACGYCRENRLYQYTKAKKEAEAKIKEWMKLKH